MKYMPIEMKNDFKKDVLDGKIWGLKLVKTPVDVIEDNFYADIFDAPREITRFDENCFYLKTRRKTPYYLKGGCDGKNYSKPDYSIPDLSDEECEAYFEVFNYYDGTILKSIVDIPAAVYEKDTVKITEYEVIRSY